MSKRLGRSPESSRGANKVIKSEPSSGTSDGLQRLDPVRTLNHPCIGVCEDCDFAHISDTLFRCDGCSGVFNHKLDFFAHLLLDHESVSFAEFPKAEYTCELCRQDVGSAAEWRKHNQSKHKTCATHLCCENAACIHAFATREGLNKHLEKTPTCGRAGDVLTSAEAEDKGNKHCSMCKGMKPHTFKRLCTLCPNHGLFVDNLELTLHIMFRHKKQITGASGNYFCEVCRETSRTMQDLQRHRHNVHRICHKHFFCRRNTACQFVFSLNDKQQIHDPVTCRPALSTQDQPPPIKSIYESKPFLTSNQSQPSPSLEAVKKPEPSAPKPQNDKKTVKLVSLGEWKVLHCGDCSRSFGASSLLECTRCPADVKPQAKMFVSTAELHAHIAQAHDEVIDGGKYSCPFCAHETSNALELSRHLESAHGVCKTHVVCPVAAAKQSAPNLCNQLRCSVEALRDHGRQSHQSLLPVHFA